MSVLDTTDREYLVWQPHAGLKSWLHHYSGFYEALTQPIWRLQVPRAQVSLVLAFGDDLEMRPVSSDAGSKAYQSFVVGINAQPLMSKHSGLRACIDIPLRPWVAHRLFQGAETEGGGEAIALEDLWGSEALRLTAQLSELPNWSQRFALIDQMLMAKFATSHRRVRPEIRWAWNQLVSHHGCLPIRQLAQAIGWSDRYFAQRFRESIGVTPKAAARQIRFAQAYDLITNEADQPLSQIALTCGYSDQSHLTREFQAFSGYSPAALQQETFTPDPEVPRIVIEPQR